MAEGEPKNNERQEGQTIQTDQGGQMPIVADDASQQQTSNIVCGACPGTKPMQLLTSIADLKKLDAMFWEVTKDLPLRPGSIFKVPSESYQNWRIGLTPENEAEIESLSDYYVRKDYVDRRLFKGSESAIRTPFGQSVVASMARTMGHIVEEILRSSDDGKSTVNILDIATGRGRTSCAIAAALTMENATREMLMKRTVFHLVDYNGEMLKRAQDNLRQFAPARIQSYHYSDEEFFNEDSVTVPEFDVVASLCHFSKKSFKDRIFRKIEKFLKPGGIVISGDWHSSLCDHPSYVYRLLEKMGLERERLKKFRDLFGDPDSPALSDKNQEENQGVRDHQSYWSGVYFDLLKSTSNRAREPKIYFMGAFDTTRGRVARLESTDLIVDTAEIRKAFPEARLPDLPKRMIPNTDRASVTVGLKRRGV